MINMSILSFFGSRLGLGLILAATTPTWDASAVPQTRPSRPGLIRDTDKAEGKEEAEPTKEKSYNPLEAERNFRVGDFYFKKKNYAAAIQRYMEALDYQPNLVKAYEALGRAYEKSGNAEKAKEVYRDYIRKNPESTKVPEFQSRLARLENPS
jgi:tetratricopeptide (TPR) repeat protein